VASRRRGRDRSANTRRRSVHANLAALNPDNFRDKYDIIFTPYNQMQSVEGTPRLLADDSPIRCCCLTRTIMPAASAPERDRSDQGPENRRRLGELGHVSLVGGVAQELEERGD
jgi:hypothetical protein